MTRKLIFIAPLAILGIVAFITVGGAIVMGLWNWLLPPLFGWPEITFWKALGLLALCRILFGGFGYRASVRSGLRHRISERMAQKLSRRMEHMTPEERERFRRSMRERCGSDLFPAEDDGE